MKYAEAFKKLGYKLDNHQTDWSAEKADGVCISMWRDKVKWNASPPYFDTDEAWPDWEPGADKIGHRKRTQHIELARDKHDGFVDIVLRRGTYDEQHGDAEPWDWKSRGGRWKISRFVRSNGKFRAEVVVHGKGSPPPQVTE